MVEVDKIVFRNFMSYGDYDVTVPIAKLGPCLIAGPNGAGKSSVANAILYALFGRTMHAAQPGDRVINELSGKDCLVSLYLKNGDVITRTRKMQGRNELVVERGGEALLSTLSTTANQQAQLNRIYNLNWHSFCNTAFLTQIGRTWFEMPEPQRKKEIERAMRIDILTLRGKVAKDKLDKAASDLGAVKLKIDSVAGQVDTLTTDIAEAAAVERGFDDNKQSRLMAAIQQARDYQHQYEEAQGVDVDVLKRDWAAVDRARQAVREIEGKIALQHREVLSHEARERETARSIGIWEARSGKVCVMCEQDVPVVHACDKVQPFVTAREEAATKVEAGRAEIVRLTSKVNKISSAIATAQPTLSVREAEAINARRASLRDATKRWATQAVAIKAEVNPHGSTVVKLQKRLGALTAERDSLRVDFDRLASLIKHFTYIYRSYNDRRRIKSYSVAKFRPFLNSRLNYYLGKFKLNIKLEITDSLSVTTDKRDYDFLSGGERKRVDAAFMLARFDTHEERHGQQSNVIVLDEVDARMDEEGVECLADVVLNDLAERVDAVLVISHKKVMRDIFPRQIVVEKRGELSALYVNT